MKKTIEINNLGQIHRKITVDLSKNINIIIGQQSIGRSTLVKTVYFCKTAPTKLMQVLLNFKDQWANADSSAFIKQYVELLSLDFRQLFSGMTFAQDTCIKYFYTSNLYLEITFIHNLMPHIGFSSDLENTLHEEYKAFAHELEFVQNLNTPDLASLSSKICNNHWKILMEKLEETGAVYIPATRAMANVFLNLYDKGIISALDVTYNQYLSLAASSRRGFSEENLIQNIKTPQEKTVELDSIRKLRDKILQARYVFRDGADLLQLDDNKPPIKASSGSSGQQEILWLLNIMYYMHRYKICFIIEEPETNLFPATQMEVLKYIIAIANMGNNEVIITTHSPYMLTSANMLLYAGANKEYVTDEVEELCQINPDEFNCYYMEQDKCRSIYEDGEIDTDYIDSVSEHIYGNIDKIMDRKLTEESK